MKKFTLLSAAIATTLCSMAFTMQPIQSGLGNATAPLDQLGFAVKTKHAPLKAASRVESEELSMAWGYCGDPGNAFPFGFGEVRQAVRLTSDLAAIFAGAEVNSLSVGNPLDYQTYVMSQGTLAVNPVKEATVWISESLDGEPVASATGTLSDLGLGWSTIEFDAPYVITGDKEVYFGYTYVIETGTQPNWQSQVTYSMVTDYGLPCNKNSNLVYSTFAGVSADGQQMLFSDEPQWVDLAALSGSNACILANVTGDNLPVDKIDIAAIQMPRTVVTGEDFIVQLMLTNKGSNKVSDVTVSLAIEGQEIQQQTLPIITGQNPITGEFITSEIGYNESGYLFPAFKSPVDCAAGFTLSISEVNGKPNKGTDFSFTDQILSLTDGFRKNNVVEEGTGTWCGWCVLGIAGMDYMRENYSDRGFIGIALHNNDQMEVLNDGLAYEFMLPYFRAFPNSYMNRNYLNIISPNPENLASAFEAEENTPAVAEVAASVTAHKKNEAGVDVISLDLNAEFCLDLDSDAYGFAYVVTEDNVGPYFQQNYCAGQPYDYYGYEKEPSIIMMTFNEVARNCSRPEPIEGSIPAEITKGEAYTYSTDVILDGVSDIENCKVVAMVVNKLSGLIENACEIDIMDNLTSAPAIQSDKTPFAYGAAGMIGFRGVDSASVYSIDGRKVADVNRGESVAVPAGIYMVTSGSESVKIAVK